MKSLIALLILTIGLASAVPPASAGSIVEAARKERERQEEIRKKRGKTAKARPKSTRPAAAHARTPARDATTASGEVKVMSNNSLKTRSGRVSEVTPHSEPSSPPRRQAVGDSEGGDDGAGETEPPASAARDRAYWSDRMKTANDGVSQSQRDLADLNTKIGQLRRAVSSIDDPNLRMQKHSELLASQADLKVKQAALANARKGVTDLREEARRSGAPAGWLR